MLQVVRGWTLLGIGLLAACHGELVASDTKERQLSNCRWVPHLKRTVCNDASPADESHGQVNKGREPAQPAVKSKASEHCMAAPQVHANVRGTYLCIIEIRSPFDNLNLMCEFQVVS